MRRVCWIGVGLAVVLSVVASVRAEDKVPPLFEKKRKPAEHDWLARIREDGQTLDMYRAARPVRARPGEVLAFLPVGPFNALQQKTRTLSIEFAGIWYQLDTRTLKSQPLPQDWHRVRSNGKQYDTNYFLRHLLPGNRPHDAVSVQAVTMADLFPEESWNFVFGMADLRRRIGVWSFARFQSSFYGGRSTPRSRHKLLRRACQLVVHEIGHVFGLAHCVRYECTMNGSNSLQESDTQPLHLCPPCHRKLRWNRRWDTKKRLVGLRDFCERNQLTTERDWFVRRLQQLAKWRAQKKSTGESTQKRTGESAAPLTNK